MSPTDSIRPQLDRIQQRAFVVGGIFLLASVAGALINRDQFFRSWLAAFFFWNGVMVGSMALLMMHHLVGGRWGFAIRRFLESATRLVPLMIVLMLPLLAGLPSLYEWARPEEVAHDAVLRQKALYLNVPFFLLRFAIYFAVWQVLSHFLNKWSAEQDHGNTPELVLKLQNLSGPGLVLYAITITFASIDLLMSLEPHWFSTIYGMIIMAGQGVGTLGFMIVVTMLLARRTEFGRTLSTVQYHDLGNLLLAFVMLWAYTSFSQLLLIYAGNLPDETPFYLRRINGLPAWVATGLIVFHFAIPFVLLLSRDIKRHLNRLAAVAVLLIVMRIVDLMWLVKPAGGPGPGLDTHNPAAGFHWLDIAAPLAIGGIWVGFFIWQLKRRPLTPLETAVEVHHG